MALVSSSSAQSALRSTVARALARALVLGIDNAAEEGHPLTQNQQISMATMAVMCYDEAIEACELVDVESMFRKDLQTKETT